MIEAAHQGTPAVGYNVHGLRDSIRDGQTGVLVEGPSEAARVTLELLGDRERYDRMVEASRAHARTFVWSQRATEFASIVESVIADYDAAETR